MTRTSPRTSCRRCSGCTCGSSFRCSAGSSATSRSGVNPYGYLAQLGERMSPRDAPLAAAARLVAGGRAAGPRHAGRTRLQQVDDAAVRPRLDARRIRRLLPADGRDLRREGVSRARRAVHRPLLDVGTVRLLPFRSARAARFRRRAGGTVPAQLQPHALRPHVARLDLVRRSARHSAVGELRERAHCLQRPARTGGLPHRRVPRADSADLRRVPDVLLRRQPSRRRAAQRARHVLAPAAVAGAHRVRLPVRALPAVRADQRPVDPAAARRARRRRARICICRTRSTTATRSTRRSCRTASTGTSTC